MTGEGPRRMTRHPVLGPDPEPLTCDRFERIVGRVAERLADTGTTGAPRACPLERASGRSVPCHGRSCLYHRVPGVPATCAVVRWSGSERPNRRLATWFIARRRETERALSTSTDSDEPKEDR